MKKLLLITLSTVFCAGAAEYQLHLTPESTEVRWTLGDVLHTVHGTFKLRRGDIVFDAETGSARGEVVVDAASGASGSSARDARMHKQVLESAIYPDVSFAPDRLEGKVDLIGTSNVKLHGKFTIHGATHEITVPVQVSAKGNTVEAEIKFNVPYVEWGMKDPSTFILKVNKSVQIEVKAACGLAGAENRLQAGGEIKPPEAKQQTPAAAPPVTVQPVQTADAVNIDKSAVYRINPDNTVETLWTSRDENVYDLLALENQVLFSTDQNGRIYRLSTGCLSLMFAGHTGEPAG
jgi:polyisoprenoid-binding protein YceI